MKINFFRYHKLFEANTDPDINNLSKPIFKYLEECEWIAYKYKGIEFGVLWNGKNVIIEFKDDIPTDDKIFMDYSKYIHDKFSYSSLVNNYPGIYFTAFCVYDPDINDIYLFDLTYGEFFGNFYTNQKIAEKMGCKKCELYMKAKLSVIVDEIKRDIMTPIGTNLIIRPTYDLYSNTYERIIATHMISRI